MKRQPLTFTIRLRAQPDCYDPDRALQAALKSVLRHFKLKAVSVVEDRPDHPDQPQESCIDRVYPGDSAT